MLKDKLTIQQWFAIAIQKSAEGIVLEISGRPEQCKDTASWLVARYCTRRCLVMYRVKVRRVSMYVMCFVSVGDGLISGYSFRAING